MAKHCYMEWASLVMWLSVILKQISLTNSLQSSVSPVKRKVFVWILGHCKTLSSLSMNEIIENWWVFSSSWIICHVYWFVKHPGLVKSNKCCWQVCIDREAREIIHLVVSLSVRLRIYGLGLPSAKKNHHDTWNTVQDLCAFVSNQETFTTKRCAQRLRAFNFSDWKVNQHTVIPCHSSQFEWSSSVDRPRFGAPKGVQFSSVCGFLCLLAQTSRNLLFLLK